MHEMYAVDRAYRRRAKEPVGHLQPSPPVPGPNEDLEVIAATKEENGCTFV